MIRTNRQILGHSFHEPERRIYALEDLLVRSSASLLENVILELVHHFVREHLLEAAEVASERHDEAMAAGLRDSTHSFAKVAGHIVLPKVRARCEENDRLLFAELVAKDS